MIPLITVPHTGTHFAMRFLEVFNYNAGKDYKQMHCMGIHMPRNIRYCDDADHIVITLRDPTKSLQTVYSRHDYPRDATFIERWKSAWCCLHGIAKEYKEKLVLIDIETHPDRRVLHLKEACTRLGIDSPKYEQYAKDWKPRGSRNLPYEKLSAHHNDFIDCAKFISDDIRRIYNTANS